MLLECDGVLVDLHGDGHRVAFNEAFKVDVNPHGVYAADFVASELAWAAFCSGFWLGVCQLEPSSLSRPENVWRWYCPRDAGDLL